MPGIAVVKSADNAITPALFSVAVCTNFSPATSTSRSITSKTFSNSKTKQALSQAKSLHATFHSGMDQVNNYMAKGWDSQAGEALTNEAKPAANGMFTEFQALRDEAQRAQTLFEKSNHEVCGDRVVMMIYRIFKGAVCWILTDEHHQNLNDSQRLVYRRYTNHLVL
jgi:hypothetical protein